MAYNNAQAVVVGGGDDDDLVAGIHAEGTTATTDGVGLTTGTSTTHGSPGTGKYVDASTGITSGFPNVQTSPGGPGSTRGSTGSGYPATSTQITHNYSGVDGSGISDEDDQKSDVYRVQM